MACNRVNAAKFIARHLPEPHETDLGGPPAHHLLATAFADIACPPPGHHLSWDDCYSSADMLPLPRKADLLLDPNGKPHPLPDHLVGEARERAAQARQKAAWIRREAHRRGLR
ncbi:hypothetical protein [Streptomyces sp. NPDC006610]|uniref:hypothetical protein n=1 Tax=Streptomyces sp. NPDC006610 TaxID=3154584 RepID=UPI0033B0E16B